MFEHLTFESILQDALSNVPSDIDKREGAVIYDALAPTALKLAEAYAMMDYVLRITFADSSDGDFLTRRVGEFGVDRKPASKAIRKVLISNTKSEPMSVPIGTLFYFGEIAYELIEEIEIGKYKAQAGTVGAVGNKDFGDLLLVKEVKDLGKAILADVLIPGEDEETDASLYAKYLDHIRNIAFGGNRAEYRRKIMQISGIGGVRVYRAPRGGGTVKVVIVDSDFNEPTTELTELVQEIIDPTPYTGEGYGTAPIGHEVTIEAASTFTIDFETTLILNEVTVGQVETEVNEIVTAYFAELRKQWPIINGGNGASNITVRILQLEARILEIEGVVDVTNSLLNEADANIIVTNSLPVLGQVTLNG